MFEVGQMIYQKIGKFKGTVLEVAGDTVYIELSNGVEAEFNVNDMTDSQPVSGHLNIGSEGLSTILTMEQFTEDHRKVLKSIPDVVKGAIGGLYERLPFSGKWSGCNEAQQLNLICALSRTPYETIQRYVADPGMMAIIMARGIGQTVGIVI